ncbi:unnamed protein product [Larinioides sclopetarius]|uniref:Uncharacterized protein n=1 Tax=Larinioides sclopetarius TaxID=280406 RepID=A0AAV2B5Z2_9ARAC
MEHLQESVPVLLVPAKRKVENSTDWFLNEAAHWGFFCLFRHHIQESVPALFVPAKKRDENCSDFFY